MVCRLGYKDTNLYILKPKLSDAILDRGMIPFYEDLHDLWASILHVFFISFSIMIQKIKIFYFVSKGFVIFVFLYPTFPYSIIYFSNNFKELRYLWMFSSLLFWVTLLCYKFKFYLKYSSICSTDFPFVSGTYIIVNTVPSRQNDPYVQNVPYAPDKK